MNDTAIIFVMNWKYIRPLKVLLYSLYKQNSLQNIPIIMVTDDKRVLHDPFVRAVCHSIEFMGEEELAPFSSIRGEKIAEKSKVAFAPKYTFLKFSIFKERGFKRHIFIDADMLCLNPLDEELLAADYHVKAMKEVASSHFPIRAEDRSKFNEAKSLASVTRAFEPQENAPGTGINSGFVVLEDGAISDDVFDLAISVASSEAFGAEQPATSEVIRRIPDCKFLELPIWYNARRRVFESLGETFFDQHANRIKLLHYTPGKPWVLGDRTPDYLDKLWLKWEQDSLEWVDEVTIRGSLSD